jgi:electron transfer flavoprotein alpha subunit
MIRTLVLLEHDGQQLKRPSLGAVTLARQLGGPYALLVIGSGAPALAEAARGFGAASVLVADDPALAQPLADRYAAVIAQAVRSAGAQAVAGISSTFSKDVLPRAAALLDAAMLTDVTAVVLRDGEPVFHRPSSAGRLTDTVELRGAVRVLTGRGTAYPPPSPDGAQSPVERLAVDASALPAGTQFVSRARPVSGRPDVAEARVVVSGGRPLGDKETFDRLIGGLADALGGAVAATRAAVDAGMAPNDLQVGQTGKIIAPELYIAVGVSGAIQHMAGVQDSRVIVAINRDPEAPVFQMANYGLVGDLHQVVPRLIDALRKA